MIYHIHKRLAPRGGNQFYKDRSVRKVETFCGADPTIYDQPERNWFSTWAHPEKGVFDVCPMCKSKATS